MLVRFDNWPDMLQHVRSGGMVYYLPDNKSGPERVSAHPIRQGKMLRLIRCDVCSGERGRIYVLESQLPQLYRWVPSIEAP